MRNLGMRIAWKDSAVFRPAGMLDMCTRKKLGRNSLQPAWSTRDNSLQCLTHVWLCLGRVPWGSRGRADADALVLHAMLQTLARLACLPHSTQVVLDSAANDMHGARVQTAPAWFSPMAAAGQCATCKIWISRCAQVQERMQDWARPASAATGRCPMPSSLEERHSIAQSHHSVAALHQPGPCAWVDRNAFPLASMASAEASSLCTFWRS